MNKLNKAQGKLQTQTKTGEVIGKHRDGSFCYHADKCELVEAMQAQTKAKEKAGHTPLTKAEADSAFDGRENHVSDWPYRDLKLQLAQTKAQRDELLAALRDLLANGGPISDPVSRGQAQNRARTAIARAQEVA